MATVADVDVKVDVILEFIRNVGHGGSKADVGLGVKRVHLVIKEDVVVQFVLVELVAVNIYRGDGEVKHGESCGAVDGDVLVGEDGIGRHGGHFVKCGKGRCHIVVEDRQRGGTYIGDHGCGPLGNDVAGILINGEDDLVVEVVVKHGAAVGLGVNIGITGQYIDVAVVVGVRTQILAGGEDGLAISEAALDVRIRVVVIEVTHIDVLAIDSDAHNGLSGLGEVGGVGQVGHGVALYIHVLGQGSDLVGLRGIDDVLVGHVEPVGGSVTQANELVTQLGEHAVLPGEFDFAFLFNNGHTQFVVVVHAVGIIGIAHIDNVELRQLHHILAVACRLGLDPGQDGEPDVTL